ISPSFPSSTSRCRLGTIRDVRRSGGFPVAHRLLPRRGPRQLFDLVRVSEGGSPARARVRVAATQLDEPGHENQYVCPAIYSDRGGRRCARTARDRHLCRRESDDHRRYGEALRVDAKTRVNGIAQVEAATSADPAYLEAQSVVKVLVQQVFPNCSRYIHKLQLVERSGFVPRPSVETPTPAWKCSEWACDVLPGRER